MYSYEVGGQEFKVSQKIDGARVVRERIDYDNRNRMVFIGRDGWPVEGIIGRRVKTFIRRLLLTRRIERYGTWLERTNQRISF